MGAKIGVGIGIVIMLMIITVIIYVGIQLPAQVQYTNTFGQNVIMAAQGSTTLTGKNSIQDYINRFWTQMNQTFDTNNFDHIYNSGWWWVQTGDNSLAKENEYLSTINNSINTRQDYINGILNGTIHYTGLNDPIQTEINQTRQEINAYGGLDWVTNGAWFLQNANFAWWFFALPFGYGVIMWIIGLIVAAILILWGLKNNSEW